MTDRALELIEEKQDDLDKIFEAIADYSNINDKNWWGFDSQSFWTLQTRDSEYAFRDAGLVYLTDGIILNHDMPTKEG